MLSALNLLLIIYTTIFLIFFPHIQYNVTWLRLKAQGHAKSNPEQPTNTNKAQDTFWTLKSHLGNQSLSMDIIFLDEVVTLESKMCA